MSVSIITTSYKVFDALNIIHSILRTVSMQKEVLKYKVGFLVIKFLLNFVEQTAQF